MAILYNARLGILLADIDTNGKLVKALCNNNVFDGIAIYCRVKKLVL